MTPPQDPSLRFYAENASTYAGRNRRSATDRLDPFLARLPPGARILELGCGSGADSEAMIALGFDVDPTDGTPQMAEEAGRRLGRQVTVLRFAELDAHALYDGIWANACLLHVPRAELADVLARIWRALKPGGTFYASFKAGTQEGMDRLERYYNRPDSDWLDATYVEAGWQRPVIEQHCGGGYDGEPTDWLHVAAVK